ncbi:MAG: ATP-dependent DNA helicase RecG [Negativicutes bacterium]|nr:ATP-dependent DNA helicase RecG [Negativicutes bacterium]
MEIALDANIKYLKGVGPAKAALLGKLGIFTLKDLLSHYPRRYEDRSRLKPIAMLELGTTEAFSGVIANVRELRPRRGLVILRVLIRDATGTAELVWFNQSYLKKRFRPGMRIVAYGKIERFQAKIQVNNPEVEISEEREGNTDRIIPVYPAGENINQKMLRQLIKTALEVCVPPENLPPEIMAEYKLMKRPQALTAVHFPPTMEAVSEARRRLVFEELYLLQCGLLYIKQNNKNQCGIKHAVDGELVRAMERKLPFKLTVDQVKALREVKDDMEDVRPMQRLVQGDVGSGKTVIAGIALAKTVENGYQGALMAPTEILAEQHYHTLSQLMAPLGIRLAILTGKLTRRAREEVLDYIRNGLVDIVIGTHALIEEDVNFHHLGLVVTDEQHRFGVVQRAKLQAKGQHPDVLVMTATPIPRTMALTVYGDLDVSVVRQLPPGRKPVKTLFYSGQKRQEVYAGVIREVERGRQAYIVCPLVENSDKLDLQSATGLYEELTSSFFHGIPCGLLHGRMKAQEKDDVMARFYRGDIKVLIATTVIEVGVNVPNATVMVIEDAERFGLSQLHQLRGRIGRGEHQSYCVLLSDAGHEEAKARLRLMTQVSDGFTLAEKDLELRGPGQFFGARQHGMPDLKIADIIKDIDILLEARKAALKTVNSPETMSQVRRALDDAFGEHFRMIFHS